MKEMQADQMVYYCFGSFFKLMQGEKMFHK